ncbi:MAG: endonuclease III [bacterium]|nr:endonuclease III [bacterium]
MVAPKQLQREDARRWTSPSREDAKRRPNPAAIVRILRRTTAQYEIPLGTRMGLEKRSLFELLVSTVCSAQARDATTYPVIVKLFAIANTPEQLVRIPLVKFQQLLYPISYYNTKAKHLVALSRMLLTEFGGMVPGTMEELLRLPGVGRKTANLVLAEGFGKPAGITVDTHVHRISNRLGVIRSRSRAETERLLMAVLPKRLWAIWNPLLVMHGQNICAPISPKCSQCPLRNQCQRRGVTTSR